MKKVKCCIIGGGMSGLFTAWQLLNHDVYQGHEIMIIEQLPALGGRMRGKCTDQGVVLNMGAGRFCPQEHPLLTQLIDQLNIKTIPHTIVKNQKCAEQFKKKYQHVLEQSQKANQPLHKISFCAFVIKHFGVDFFNQLRTESGYDTLGQVALPLSEGLRIIDQHPESDQECDTSWHEPLDGFISIIDQLMTQLICRGVKISSECTVKSITQHQSGYEVQCRNRYQNLYVITDKLILACGKRALENIKHPFLKLHHLQNQIQVVPLFKCFMHFDHSWWVDLLNLNNGDDKQLVVLKDCLRKVYFSSQMNLLWVYNDDAAALYWGDQYNQYGKDSLQNTILDQLANSLNIPRDQIPTPTDTQVFFWREGVSFWKVGCDTGAANNTALFNIAKDVHVVTDMFAQRSGWIEGVLENVTLLIDQLTCQIDVLEKQVV